MPAEGVLRRVHAGSAPEPPVWEAIEAIFDACFGADAHGLPKLPETITSDSVWAGWTDGDGRRFTAAHLGDVEAAYRSRDTDRLYFSGWRHGGLRCDFEYNPGPPRPRARLAVEGPDDAVSTAIATAQLAFPLPFEGALIFLSWGGDRSLRVAEAIRDALRSRFPEAEVFLSKTSIDPGDDPMRRMLEEGLLRCQVLVAALTLQAAKRPWVIWETAVVWARENLVIPVFIDVAPAEVPGPLTSRVQGVHLAEREQFDRALEVIARRLALSAPAGLTSEEHAALVASAKAGAEEC